MKRICIVGTGYVGLVTGACFAEMGHRVVCVDKDITKVSALREGIVPCYEPELEPLVAQNVAAGRLSVITAYSEGIPEADFVFVCVGTPTTDDNKVDLSYMHLAYLEIGSTLNGSNPIIVNKSTVPPGTSDMMASLLGKRSNGSPPPAVVSNPEFLREGRAVSDFMHPSRVVIGADNALAAEAVADLYRPLDTHILMTDPSTAEMIKLASNSYLAMKVSFINEMASICDKVGVDVEDVAWGIGLDPRIGREFLRAGPGYGGGCLPKDIELLGQFSRNHGHDAPLINAAIEVNKRRPKHLVDQLEKMLGRLQGTTIAILGLSFKAHTDDVRHSPALALIEEALARGAQVKAYDPKANRNAQHLLPQIEYLGDPYQCAEGCDAVVIATEWPEFGELDLAHLKAVMRGSVLLDGRNIIDPERAREAGLLYRGVGRGSPGLTTIRRAHGLSSAFGLGSTFVEK